MNSTLWAYNKTGVAIPWAGIASPIPPPAPASAVPGSRAFQRVDVTREFKARGGADLAAIQALIDAGSVDFEWEGSPAFAPGFTATAQGLSTVANEQQASGELRCYVFDIADAAGDTNIVLPSKFEVHEVRGFKTGGAGGAGDTAQVKNLADAITDAISLNVADAAALSAATYDDAFSTVAGGGTLRVTIVDGNAGATDLSCRLVVSGVLRA